MTRLETIEVRAGSALALTREDGKSDHFLLEYARRIDASARRILTLDAVNTLHPDAYAVATASLFHECAWTHYVREGECAVVQVLASPTGEDHYGLSAKMLEGFVGDVLDDECLDRARHAIIGLDHRDADTPEGLVLSDAVMLEEFSVSSVYQSIRRGLLEGQTIRSLIDRWRRRAEYHYWTARLDESFHFEQVRALARDRLERLGRFITDLEREQTCDDLRRPE